MSRARVGEAVSRDCGAELKRVLDVVIPGGWPFRRIVNQLFQEWMTVIGEDNIQYAGRCGKHSSAGDIRDVPLCERVLPSLSQSGTATVIVSIRITWKKSIY